MFMHKVTYFILVAVITLCFGCKKTETNTTTIFKSIDDYREIPTVLVENYVNRMYIDLLGREPLDKEMENDVAYLRSGDLSQATRISLIKKLQFDTTFSDGEESYKRKYFNQIYNKSKGRMIEGASEAEISKEISLLARPIYDDSIAGNFEAMEIKKYERQKLYDLLDAELDYMNDSISFGDMLGRMANNKIYDIINMNTFNFVRATFDNIFFRFPTDDEFHTCFDIVEYNQARLFWGKPAQNKLELINLWINSNEFLNGTVTWLYKSLLARNPNTYEMAYGMIILNNPENQHAIQELEQFIISTDEYAHFTYLN